MMKILYLNSDTNFSYTPFKNNVQQTKELFHNRKNILPPRDYRMMLSVLC